MLRAIQWQPGWETGLYLSVLLTSQVLRKHPRAVAGYEPLQVLIKCVQTSNFNWKTWPSNFSSTLLAPSHQEYYLDQRGWEPGKVKEGCTSTYFQCRLSATLCLSVTNTNTNTQIHARRNLKILKWKIQRRYVY